MTISIPESALERRAEIMLGMSAADVSERKHFVGASDANTIMSGDKDKILQLWEEKVGKRPPEDLSDVLPVQMGVFTEPLNLFWFTKQTGCAVHSRGEKAIHPRLPFLRATLDGQTTLPCGTPAVIDAKHVGAFHFDLEETTQKYGPQIAVQMACKDVQKGVLSILIGTMGFERPVIERDPFYEAKVLKACSDFWEHVKNGTPPTETPMAEAPLPHGLLRKVDMSTSNEWGSWEGSYLAHEANAKSFEEAKAEMKKLVPADVGEAKGRLLCIKRSKDNRLLFSKVK
jgi:predicted phage-related endonuclease